MVRHKPVLSKVSMPSGDNQRPAERGGPKTLSAYNRKSSTSLGRLAKSITRVSPKSKIVKKKPIESSYSAQQSPIDNRPLRYVPLTQSTKEQSVKCKNLAQSHKENLPYESKYNT